MADQSFRVSPWTTHERLDDEVIIINLETGLYFALSGVGADAWTLLTKLGEADAIGLALAQRYEVEPELVRADLKPLFDRLVEEQLVVSDRDANEQPTGDIDLPPLSGNAVYVAPVFEAFEDLEALLLLDPIHEVDDAGWPVMREPE